MSGIKRASAVAAFGLLFAALAAAQPERSAISWGGLEFLIGEWTGGGSGQPGQGSGWFSLKFEIAPPGKPNEFKTYIEASAGRK